jgi:hypothetical protein
VNLDYWTETYQNGYYMHYMARWPNYFVVAEGPHGNVAGYSTNFQLLLLSKSVFELWEKQREKQKIGTAM